MARIAAPLAGTWPTPEELGIYCSWVFLPFSNQPKPNTKMLNVMCVYKININQYEYDISLLTHLVGGGINQYQSHFIVKGEG